MGNWDSEEEDWRREEPYTYEPIPDGHGRIIPVWAYRFGALLLLLVFAASSFMFLWHPARFSSAPEPAFDPDEYAQWIQSQAGSVVGQSRVLAVAFVGGLEDHPAMGLSAPVGSPDVVLRRVQDETLRLLGRLFTDARADTVYVVWVAPYGQSAGQPSPRLLEVIVSRERAESVDWGAVLPGDLPNIADVYRGADLASLPSIIAS